MDKLGIGLHSELPFNRGSAEGGATLQERVQTRKEKQLFVKERKKFAAKPADKTKLAESSGRELVWALGTARLPLRSI